MSIDPNQLARVRILCEQAGLPVSQSDLEALTPIYFAFSQGIEKLAELVRDDDAAPTRFVVSRFDVDDPSEAV